MSKQITLKHYSDSNNIREPYQASEDAAGYDVFAAETVNVMPKSSASISLSMIWSIPSGFYGKLFTRSGIFKEHLVTFESGVIDSDYRGEVSALLFNHHPEKTFTASEGDRIAQVVFMETFTVNFQRVTDKHFLGITKRGSDGFGSTGFSVTKKKTLLEVASKQVSSDENLSLVSEKADNETQTTSEEATSEEPQIASEEVIMSVNNEVVIHASITISD